MSVSKLLNDMALTAKGWYGQTHAHPNVLLCIFQHWTGTKDSTYVNLLDVVLPEFVKRRVFTSASPEKKAEMIMMLIQGTQVDRMMDRRVAMGFDMPGTDMVPAHRATRALYSMLANSLAEHIFEDGAVHEFDEELRDYLDREATAARLAYPA